MTVAAKTRRVLHPRGVGEVCVYTISFFLFLCLLFYKQTNYSIYPAKLHGSQEYVIASLSCIHRPVQITSIQGSLFMCFFTTGHFGLACVLLVCLHKVITIS